MAVGKQWLLFSSIRLGAFAFAGKVFADMGSNLQDMSERTGLSVEALSELGFAAEQSGASIETLEMAVKAMQRFMSEKGPASLKGLAPEKQFEALAKAVAAIQDPTERAAKAMEIFGAKAGTKLLPMIKDMDALRAEARRLGLVMSTEDAAAADKFGDTLSSLWATLKRGVALLGSAIVPQLQDAAKFIMGIVKAAANWIKENKALVASMFALFAVDVVLGAAVFALGGIFKVVAIAVGIFSTAISVAVGLLTFMLTPIGLVVAAVGGLATWFFLTQDAGKQMVGRLGEQFGQLAGLAKTAWGGIAAALASGDFAGAAAVAWKALQIGWFMVVEFVKEQWTIFKGWLVGNFGEQLAAITAFLSNAWSAIRTVFEEVIAIVVSVFDWFTKLPEGVQRWTLIVGAIVLIAAKLGLLLPAIAAVKFAMMAMIAHPIIAGFVAAAVAISAIGIAAHKAANEMARLEKLSRLAGVTQDVSPEDIRKSPGARRILALPKDQQKAEVSKAITQTGGRLAKSTKDLADMEVEAALPKGKQGPDLAGRRSLARIENKRLEEDVRRLLALQRELAGESEKKAKEVADAWKDPWGFDDTKDGMGEMLKDFEKMLAEMEQKRRAAELWKDPWGFDDEQARPRLPNIDDVAKAKDRIEVAGTFNAAAIRALGASSTNEMLAKNMGVVAANSKALPRIEENTKQAIVGQVFV